MITETPAKLDVTLVRSEIGLFPSDWPIRRLDQIAGGVSVGLVINPSTYISDHGTVPMLLGSQVKANKIDHEAARRITPQSNAKIPASILRAGDLVTVRVGDPGTTAVITDELDGCNCASMMIVRRETRFNSSWLSHLMNSHLGRRQVANVQYGTAQKQFNISDAVGFLFPVPPKVEQDAISQALNDANTLIDSLEQLLTKKRQIKQGAMQELLTGKRRLPGFTGEWKTATLGQIARVKTGSMNNQDKVEDGDYPFFVRSQVVERIDTFTHECEAILVPGEGGIGNIFHYIKGRFALHQRVYGVTDFSDEVLGRFLYFYMRVFFGAHAMENSVKATVDSLRLPTFLDFEVRLPPTKNEQIAIAEVLSDLESEAESLESRLTKAREIKQAMAQALLTGRIRLVEPNT